MFVVEIRPGTREVVVGSRDDLLADVVELGDLNWLVSPDGVAGEVEVQLRHRARPAAARMELVGDRAHLRLLEPQPAVTPGQSGVIFRGDRMLGGGRIQSQGGR